MLLSPSLHKTLEYPDVYIQLWRNICFSNVGLDQWFLNENLVKMENVHLGFR